MQKVSSGVLCSADITAGREVGIGGADLVGEGLALGAVHEEHEEVHVVALAEVHVEAGQLRQPPGEGGDVGAVAGGVLGRGRGAGHHRHAHRLVPAAQQRRRLAVHEAAAEVDVLVVERDAVEVADQVGVGEGHVGGRGFPAHPAAGGQVALDRGVELAQGLAARQRVAGDSAAPAGRRARRRPWTWARRGRRRAGRSRRAPRAPPPRRAQRQPRRQDAGRRACNPPSSRPERTGAPSMMPFRRSRRCCRRCRWCAPWPRRAPP